MDRYNFFQLTFILLFFISGPPVSACSVKITEPQDHLYSRINQSVSIFCHINMSDCKDNHYNVFWYVFKQDSHYQLNTVSQPHKYSMEKEMLQINSLSHHDGGVYYCAAVKTGYSESPGMQAFGKGTTLIVQDIHYSTGQILLITLVVLLSLYSLLILSLIICIKMGKGTSLIQKKKTNSQVKNESVKSAHFGAVVQELYSKRNLRSSKQHSATLTSDGSSKSKLRSPAGTDDIYQNLKMT